MQEAKGRKQNRVSGCGREDAMRELPKGKRGCCFFTCIETTSRDASFGCAGSQTGTGIGMGWGEITRRILPGSSTQGKGPTPPERFHLATVHKTGAAV